MAIVKIAVIVKRKNKWCIRSHKKDKDGKYKMLGCFDTKEKAKKHLKQIYFFKHKKAMLLNMMTDVIDKIESKGFYHIADAINICMEAFATNKADEQTAIKLMKIANILEKKGEFELNEQIDSVIPYIFDKSFDED